MAIPYRTAKFTSAIVILGSTAKFNSHQYFRLYGNSFITDLSLQELRETLAEELDFEHEGHNQERCAHDMVHFPYVYIPKV